MANAITNHTSGNSTPMQEYVFANAQSFESAQRMATALSKSTMVPKEYQGNVANAIVALEVAQRTGASPLMVMQNLYIVHGKPSWSSQFIIAALNTCGRFSPLKFNMKGEGDSRTCFVSAKDNENEVLEGPIVSIEMSKAEGWYNKNGSKWKTMPDLMLRYRAATFFGRLYAPDVLMGMHTEEEVRDSGVKDITPATNNKALKEAFLNEAEITEDGEVIESKPETSEDKLSELLDDAKNEEEAVLAIDPSSYAEPDYPESNVEAEKRAKSLLQALQTTDNSSHWQAIFNAAGGKDLLAKLKKAGKGMLVTKFNKFINQ